MSKKPTISIIIPMYNTEKYVEKCLDSIINQTYKDIEVIIVNDGSTDNSREICEKYVQKDDRIILINTENRGAGSARNTGLEQAKGDYISFIDSDDYICNDYYERLYNMLQVTKADISVGRYQRISENEKIQFYNSGEIKEYTKSQALHILYGEDESKYINMVILPNKLFSRKLFRNDIKYPIGRLIDDEFIIYKLIDRSNKIAYTDDVMYAYVQSGSSVMRTDFKEKRVYDTIDVYDEVYAFFKNYNDEELGKKILTRYLSYCVELAKKTFNSKIIDDKRKVYKYLEDKLKEKAKIAKGKVEQDKYEKFHKEFYEIIDS